MSQKQPRVDTEKKIDKGKLMYLEVMRFEGSDRHYIDVDHGDRIIEGRGSVEIKSLFDIGDRFLFSAEDGKIRAFFEKKAEKWTIDPDVLDTLTEKLFSVV